MAALNPILSKLALPELEEAAAKFDIPKWNSLCLLRLLGLPTLDAAFISPGSFSSTIKKIGQSFADHLGVDKLLVRSDGGRETKQYFRGGDTLPLFRVIELAASLAASGRTVLLMEPTNRFCNRVSRNFLVNSDGSFAVEILGPGYDISDLNRGGIPPQYVISGAVSSWQEYERIRASDLMIEKVLRVKEATRRCMRLERIGKSMLPAMGIAAQGDPIALAERWLRARGFTFLWENQEATLKLGTIRAWYDDAFLLAEGMARYHSWTTLVLSGSQLSDGRFIYWDVVNANDKFASPRRQGPICRQEPLKYSPNGITKSHP